ncbi:MULTISPECIES: RNA polymerase sigma factor [Lysinibacillus]|uniref:Sigma-70 family RNA polymerase sigma factor n=1 Tax=Lysinibacillus antri TaxID=2498145 RepID=A0A3S0QP13_9BACI|nr:MULTISPECIES: sigma-70 family RNA polymerase sigma factor [Lysinibacillus]RUL50887.1 sigma-70 family RNA polymerase sigma factor [Lysinibacillus antri]TSI09684.1 sigma-70 family RNA polymerase sigma factor [Lysinibacillus sp. BW-2-10]
MEDSFLDMYDHYFNDVYRYVYVKTGNKWDTEDIVSDIFRKSYEKFHHQTIQNQKAWLFAIARNSIVDYYRKKKGVPVEDLELYTAPVPFEDSLELSEEMSCLQKSLHVLHKEEQEIINLRFFAELKFKEVASLLNKPDNSIRVKTIRITKKLKILINKCLGET